MRVSTITPENSRCFNIPASDGSFQLDCSAADVCHQQPINSIPGIFASLNSTPRGRPTTNSNGNHGNPGDNQSTPPNNGVPPGSAPDALTYAASLDKPISAATTTTTATTPPSEPAPLTPNIFPFDTVIDCTGDASHMLQMNALCRRISATREQNLNYFAACCFGYFGFVFSDLGDKHEYV